MADDLIGLLATLGFLLAILVLTIWYFWWSGEREIRAYSDWLKELREMEQNN